MSLSITRACRAENTVGHSHEKILFQRSVYIPLIRFWHFTRYHEKRKTISVFRIFHFS